MFFSEYAAEVFDYVAAVFTLKTECVIMKPVRQVLMLYSTMSEIFKRELRQWEIVSLFRMKQ